MKLFLSLALALAIWLGLAGLLSAQEMKESEYYPLRVGTTWEYKVRGRPVVARVAGFDRIDNVVCARVEALLDGKVVTTEHIAVKDDGVYRYQYQGQKVEPPLCFLQLPPVKGTRWTFNSSISGQASRGTFTLDETEITVPAGKFKAVASQGEFESNGQKQTITYWFVPGVGIVKQVLKLGSEEVVIELDRIIKP